jgi:GTP diphosphokinase / guanosine-3',5'-bis(diphosphate) 3'-diphosphatase
MSMRFYWRVGQAGWQNRFAPQVIAAIAAASRRAGDIWTLSAARGGQPIGRAVKLAGLRDNMDLSRIAHPTARDVARIETYRVAVAILEQISG